MYVYFTKRVTRKFVINSQSFVKNIMWNDFTLTFLRVIYNINNYKLHVKEQF